MCQKMRVRDTIYPVFGLGRAADPFRPSDAPDGPDGPRYRRRARPHISGRPPSASKLAGDCDVVIEPIMTPLLTAARHQRLTILTGNAMLRFQMGLWVESYGAAAAAAPASRPYFLF